MNNQLQAPTGKIENGIFKFPIRIYYEDTDAGGIVYYANYLKYAERARTEFLRFIGAAQQSEALENDACGFVVRHLEIDYKAPARLDDFLTASCEVLDARGAAAVIFQKICRGEELLAQINVQVAYVSLARKRPVRIPENIMRKFKA